MGPHPRPWDGMTDDDLMALAKRVLMSAASEAPGSIERAVRFAGYDSVVAELQRRLANRLADQLGLPEEP